MTVPARHLLKQGPMLRTLGLAAVAPLQKKLRFRTAAIPVGEFSRTLPPLADDLIEDFIREMGGDPAVWRGAVPPHLFPQWGLPVAAELMRALPYPIHKMLNAGCRLELREALPAGRPMQVHARLDPVDADERRAKIRGVITTGTEGAPEALVASVDGYIPLAPRAGGSGKEKPVVPAGARRLAEWRLPWRAGLDFALLTGDFNPLHWVPPYARAMGFRSNILHGYALMARALEGLVAGELGGDPSKLASIEVRFTTPLPLPAAPSLFVGEGGALFVGKGVGEPANLVGTFQRR